MYAVTDFVHLDLDVKTGDKFPDNHRMVRLRPDLFSAQKPKPAKGHTSTEKE